ncbi:hypothetical protein PUNSTDRAFT_137270 [Punctularia strigosozonata HHB-11173 SS5]|uniref:uncharacterized protein n=1 Tax=Punctularia strigosozonata (strain HHB-11173) TaxID=741275 RepID=UPI00044186D7|nr:uncharacterized protein PUNSTDRAFT_137270 [Punctularia strigosozonata HHB-11173 SS5]EIN05779.1 hypothetical protein PUNSTDRAFT_137270 [Punctularia strigosozonata HHB-11173 SS5]
MLFGIKNARLFNTERQSSNLIHLYKPLRVNFFDNIMMFERLALAAASQGVFAVSWQPFFIADCSGTVENSGSYTGGSPPMNGNGPQQCIRQHPASVDFAQSGGVRCSLYHLQRPELRRLARSTSATGASDFGGTGQAIVRESRAEAATIGGRLSIVVEYGESLR